MTAPLLADHFERTSVVRLLARRQPYDFVDTYRVLEHAYGYRSHYVNLGLWTPALVPASDALDPGERLARFLFAKARLPTRARVLDVGAGLGQAAVDLVRDLGADHVTGVNINERQIGFASALARAAGASVAARIEHRRIDAAAGELTQLTPKRFHAAFAVECVGHFGDPARFLASLRTVLEPGARFVFCLNVRTGDDDAMPASFRAMLSLSYGFVPQRLAWWLDAVTHSGFTVDESGELTDDVLRKGTAFALERLDARDVRSALPRVTAFAVRRQLRVTQRAVERGGLGYAFVVATA